MLLLPAGLTADVQRGHYLVLPNQVLHESEGLYRFGFIADKGIRVIWKVKVIAAESLYPAGPTGGGHIKVIRVERPSGDFVTISAH
jgi:hypothetical protein